MKARLFTWARALRRQALAVYFAARHRHMPWLARGLALLVAAYAFSPIDLIPDFIPVLGLLDDLLVVPLGVALVLRLTPRAVRVEVRRAAVADAARPVGRAAAAVIVGLWGWRRFLSP